MGGEIFERRDRATLQGLGRPATFAERNGLKQSFAENVGIDWRVAPLQRADGQVPALRNVPCDHTSAQADNAGHPPPLLC